MKFWLMKSEPDEFSIDDLARAKNRTTPPATTEAYMDGRFDDVRVYNRALSAAEIKAVRTTPLT